MIGLFLGDTDFASEILKKIKKLNVDYFIIDLSKNKKFKNEKNFNSISIGQFGRIINLIKNLNKLGFSYHNTSFPWPPVLPHAPFGGPKRVSLLFVENLCPSP